MEKRKLIIDTDCGSDDAVAIAMAMRSSDVEVLMISAVCGNVSMEQAVQNTLTTLEYADTYFPPVYRGCASPLLRKASLAVETHGHDGLGDLGFVPKKLKPASGNGIIEMLNLLREANPGEIEIVTLGPLTNLAVALMLDPDALRRVKVISSMGGAGFGYGNVSPVAEFNIWHDGEAAKMLLDFGAPLMFIGWDACLGDAIFEEQEIDKIKTSGELGNFAIQCNRRLIELNKTCFGRTVIDMADPAAMAAVLWPDCIKTCAEYPCEVEIMNGPSYGALVIDRNHEFGSKHNAIICSQLHAELFKQNVINALSG